VGQPRPTRRYAYDLKGRLLQQWGTAEYPQAWSYTATGELHTLTTWRSTGAADLDAAAWPAPAGGDTTNWTHQSATGLFTSKQYADGAGPDYTYDPLNRIATRTWARDEESTTYGYHSASGEIISVEYSDDTPAAALT